MSSSSLRAAGSEAMAIVLVVGRPAPRRCKPLRFAPGCYWIEPQWQRFVWIAANELPLVDELIPFLLARSGQALDEFSRWVAPRRPLDWVAVVAELVFGMVADARLVVRGSWCG
jgi:hypothetical protein